MPDYELILVATDLSDPSLAAVREAATLARKLSSRLILTYVMEERLPPMVAAYASEPPEVIVLPVTTARWSLFSAPPPVFKYVSIIHTIVCALVPTSGAGMSCDGPMLPLSAWVNRRVMRRTSSSLCSRGLNLIPPLPPPKGTPMSADFQVICAASAFSSSSDTSW